MMSFFPNFHPKSKIWIFSAHQALDTKQEAAVLQHMHSFLSQWKTHGQSMIADAQLWNHCVLMVAANFETSASGCSIDAMTRVVQQMGEQFHIDWFDRLGAWIETSSGWQFLHVSEVQQAVASSDVHSNSLFVNILPQQLDQFQSSFLVPLQQSWMSRSIQWPAKQISDF